MCNLKYNQVTLAGTHNSGSGFNGNLKVSSGLPAPACIYRNQDKNYTAQLDFGIRFFDIDLCFVTKEEATKAVPAGLWTCHANAYAGLVDEILRQVEEWLNDNNNRYEIVSLYFNGDYDRSRAQNIAEALRDLLESRWWQNDTTLPPPLTMSDDYNATGEWPRIITAVNANKRVFVFLHETLQLDKEPWAHNPIPKTSPKEVVKDRCDGLIDYTRGACDVCTDLFGIQAIGSQGNCISKTAEICNQVTANVTRACFDLRMEYGKTVNVITVDFPGDSPSVVQVADMLNDLNVAYYTSPPINLSNITNCNPGYTPTPSPSPEPQPTTYCDALMQITQTPIYYFQCTPNKACDLVVCPVDLFGNGAIYVFQFGLNIVCGEPFEFHISANIGSLQLGKVATNRTGVFPLFNFPFNITLDQMGDSVGLEVSCIHNVYQASAPYWS